MPAGVLISFVGALQASVSVLLTIFSGVVAAQFGLLSTGAAEEVSSLCVKLLLPCLLISNLGSELHLETVVKYVPIIIWAALYTILSIIIGRAAAAAFRLPKWVVPIVSFNNTESLPLLLLQSLSTTGVLASLVGAGDEDDGIERARSYFLAASIFFCSVVTNTIAFGQGPELLTKSSQDSAIVKAFRWVTGWPEEQQQQQQQQQQDGSTIAGDPESQDQQQTDGQQDEEGEDGNGNDNNEDSSPTSEPDEQTSLLPRKVRQSGRAVRDSVVPQLSRWYAAAPRPVRKLLAALRMFVNPPFVGALIGAVIGVSPPLHRLFFADMAQGGYFNAWLAKALKNVGELFVALQVVVVGVKLSLSLRLWKKGSAEESGAVPLGALACVVFVRFVLWPAISIPLIWVLASRTNLLTDDPMLWWVMMMMPVGPPAMKNLALADVSGTSQKTKLSIAKFLTVSCIDI
ncbi:putative auxin efflux carrier superfamily protein [Eutypa lata UCREL1]|uniref:Putative auxin efflux carrier superfamily protein n=1 Tax=Eutypa lata (strain UCR-EL1) TaxID=1287681 RepID=M7SBM8_EUTLA|nr:putative auxin efflux carrier superfamily protein [Eutypa lata UCREL1]